MSSVVVKRTAQVAALAAAFSMSGGAMALASTHTTSGNGSILGGNQINVPISLPVDLCGNAAGILGTALAGCEGGASVTGGGSGGGSWTTSGNHSILGGNQINVPVSVPVSLCGNSAGVLGTALSGCKGGAKVRGGSGSGGASWTTSGNHSILGGNQINVPVSVPVSVCGISAAVLGTSLAGCEGGASVVGGASGASTTSTTSGNGSIGGGNQISVPVSVPVSVCGVSAAVLGNAASGCGGGAHVGTPPSHHHHGSPPPCHHHHGTPPPCHHHHHHTPPPAHHHHGGGSGSGGSGSSSGHHKLPTTATVTVASSLPTTGANFIGLLALAGGAIVAGAGSMAFAAKRGLLRGLFARRTSTVAAS
jgi:hypothetical protein